MEQYQESSNNGHILIILLLVIAMAVFGYLLWQKYYENPDKIIEKTDEEVLQQARYTMRLIVEDYKSQRLSADYTIKQLFLTQQSGNINKDVVEVYSNATYNVSYTFYADNDDYYLGRSECYNTDQCIVKLDKNADVIFTGTKLDSNNVQLIIKTTNGLIRNPIVCVGYSPYIYNLKIDDLGKTTKPDRLSSNYDRCFIIGRDISESSLYYTVSFESSVSHGNFTFNLVDSGYNADFEQSYDFDNEIPDKVIKIEI